MRTIEEIKKLKDENRRKWGKDLIAYLKPFFDEGRTYLEIIEILRTHGIEINKSELGNLKFRYGNLKQQKEEKQFGFREKVVENSDRGIDTKDYSEKKEIVQNQDNEKIDISKFDFRTPTPKPSYENWKK